MSTKKQDRKHHETIVILTFGLACLIIGLPIFVVYYLKWEASVEYENQSTATTCKVLEVSTPGICTDKNNRQTGVKHAYKVQTPLCDATLYRSDDDCHPFPLTVNTVKGCRVHDSCTSFKWKHQSTANMNSAFVGAAFVILSFVCCFFGYADYRFGICVTDQPMESVTVTDSPNPNDPDLDSPTGTKEEHCQPEAGN
eukprot:TRINITY_DN28130_c0_g1_i1.p1 TRINITY_DN28130_c0_g1~~TRINITY_DN28130_c0_g1_i1.p1  ORF type:complete len:197 (+),score=23.54 TRINITY_DN28130_c0_g1_i1:50-640(+)